MTDPVRQSVLRTQWLAQLGAVGQRVGELAGGLRRPQLDWSPPDGGWGVGQVLEHLCVANDSYLGRLRSKLARAPRLLPGADPVWRPSLMGGWLARSSTWATASPSSSCTSSVIWVSSSGSARSRRFLLPSCPEAGR